MLREGKAGDENAIPLIVNADGSDAGFPFGDPAMLTALRKVPGLRIEVARGIAESIAAEAGIHGDAGG